MGLAGWQCSAPQEVHEVDPYCLFRLANLPVRAAAAFQLFREPAGLVRQRLVRGGARQETPDPTDAVRGRSFFDQPRLQQEFAELLKGRLQLAHDAPSPDGARAAPRRDDRTPPPHPDPSHRHPLPHTARIDANPAPILRTPAIEIVAGFHPLGRWPQSEGADAKACHNHLP